MEKRDILNLTTFLKRTVRSQRGQSIIELSLTLPLLLLLALGAIEISNMINAYLVLTHLTREGANVTSRETVPASISGDLDAVISAASPVIREDNSDQWRVIYSRIGPNPAGGGYILLEQIVRGSGTVLDKRICPLCGEADFACPSTCDNAPTNVPNLDDIAPGKTFHAVEVFYDYQTITPVGNFGVALASPIFYERSIF